MTETLKNSRIFQLLYDYLTILPTASEWAGTLQNLWDTTDDAHRRVILDMFAHAEVFNDHKRAFPWAEHDTSEYGTHAALALTMCALYYRKPLEHMNGFNPDRFTQEHLSALSEEVKQQNEWRNNLPYFCDTGFCTPENYTPGQGKTHEFAGTFIKNNTLFFLTRVAVTLLVPANMAIVALKYRYHNFENITLPPEYLYDVVNFKHQYTMMKNTPHAFGITLAHCPPDMIHTYIFEGQEVLTPKQYYTFTRMFETLFPVREYAYQEVTNNVGYQPGRYWETKLALGEETSMFENTDKVVSPLPLETQLWCLNNRSIIRDDNMRLENTIVF